MEIGSIIDILRALPETVPLKAGDLLKVNVLEVFEGQRALVDLGRFRTMAAITFPVAAGDELWVRVIETQDQLRLQLVPTPADPAPSTGTAAGPAQAVSAGFLKQARIWIDQLTGAGQQVADSQRLPAEPRQALEALRFFLAPFELSTGPDSIAAKLKEFCDGSGLFLELRLADAVKTAAEGAGRAATPDGAVPDLPGRVLTTDLKARLMLLKEFFESSAGRQLTTGSREAAGLARAATEMLADIRTGQEQMAKPAAAGEPFQMVHFTLPVRDDRHQVQLKIAYSRRRPAGTPEGHRAAILLQLDRMGAVRADLMLLGRSLNVSIFVTGPEVQEMVKRHAPEVREALSTFFENVGIHVAISAPKIAQFATEDWRPLGETRVDVRA
ncbi:MAG: hypothetical protein ACM3KE_03795 [Hyphomicrobiales bacterium]